MKILWATEPVLPQIARLTGDTPSYAGSWLVSVCDGLLTDPENSLTVCYRTTAEHSEKTAGRLTAWSFILDPLSYSPQLEHSFCELLRRQMPDVIHIWGSEFPFALALLNAAERENMLDRTVVSIQGLITEVARRYTAGLPDRVVSGFTVRDLLRRDNIRRQQEKFALRGEFEVAALKKAVHIIGRTGWDFACTRQVNPHSTYHFCNETLRPAFYEGRWELDACERHSIFVSQGSYPIKGLHMALEALVLLKPEFPDIRLYTTGADPREKSIQARLRRQSYGRYLARRIRALGLDENVKFLGALSAEGMKARYLLANAALNPSSIENSSNAIGEAMLLGTPVAASSVGGTPDIVKDGEEGLLYPFDRPDLLANAIRRIFQDDVLALRLSTAARETAMRRHDAGQNLARLLEIYRGLAR